MNGGTEEQREFARGYQYAADRLAVGIEEMLVVYDVTKSGESQAFQLGAEQAIAEYTVALIKRHYSH